MAANLAWYAGQCVKRHDLNMTVKVIAIRSSDGWSLLENPQKFFPKMGEVEVRLRILSENHPNDWVIFQIAPKAHRGKWTASIYRNLIPFLDLREIGNLDALRSRLTDEGVDGPDHTGAWIIRYSEERVVMLDLMRSLDNRYRMTASGTVCVYAYESEYVYSIPSDMGEVSLYELKREIELLEEIDWSPDEGYIKRIVHCLAGARDPSAEVVIEWLKRHANEGTGRVGSSSEDRLAAQQAARSGELAKRLLADQALLRDITDALLVDPRLQALFESKTKAIAEQERENIRTALNTELELETRALSEQRLMTLNIELKALEAEQRESLRNQLSDDEKSSIRTMERRAASRQAEMEAELESRRTVLQQSLDALDAQREKLDGDLDTISALIEERRTTLSGLDAQETQTLEDIEQLKQEAASIHIPKSVRLESALRLNPPTYVTSLGISDMQKAISDCILLTAEGKESMAHFIALMLAGETPVLHGPQTHDFLLTAESLLSSGRSVRLEADPTIITFEDLWLRAGTQLPTALTYGLELARSKEATTVLAVIERAECSGARFWMPALAQRTQRGELPRRFLICATVEDVKSEEALATSMHAPWLEINGAINADAYIAAPMVLAPGNFRQLDPGERPMDISPAIKAIVLLGSKLSLMNSLRLARAAIEWARLHDSVQYEDAPRSLARFFMRPDDLQ